MSMKKILLLLMLMLAQTLSAQVCYGDSDVFCFAFNDDNPLVEYGCVRHYISAKGERTFLVISIQNYEKAIGIDKNNNVRINYNDGTHLKTVVHSSTVETLSKPYAKKKFFATLVEFPVGKNELCSGKKIKEIYIEMNDGRLYHLEIGKVWATHLATLFPELFSEAKEKAEKNRKHKQEVAPKNEMPKHIKQFIEEYYPEHSYSLIKLDSVHLPLSSIVLLDYFITEALNGLTGKIDEAEKSGQDNTQLLQQSIVQLKKFKRELKNYENEYLNPKPARGDDDDYLRTIIELNGYDSKETLMLYSRVDEESFATIDFWKEADDCRKGIQQFEELIDRLRSLQEQENKE